MKNLVIAAALSALTIAPAYADSGSAASDLSGALSQPVVRLSAVGGSVIALPLMSVGSVGGELLETSATAFSASLKHGRTLPITERTVITNRTPTEALQSDDGAKSEVTK